MLHSHPSPSSVTNHREKQQEVFRRMSCSRSSSLSLKKPPCLQQTVVSHTYDLHQAFPTTSYLFF